MHFRKYELSMTLTKDQLKRLHKLSFTTLKRCANIMGFPTMAAFYSCFSEKGFFGEAAEEMVPCKLKIKAKDALDLGRKINGNLTKYEMAKRYSLSNSNYYGAYSRKSCPKFSTLLSMLPSDADIPLFLEQLERKAVKTEVIRDASSENMTGIPSAVVVITEIMLMLKGDDRRFKVIYTYRDVNMYTDTFSCIADFWGMTDKGLALAMEKEDLILGRDMDHGNGNNSKGAILSRLMDLNGCETWADFVRLHPEYRQGAVRSMRNSIDKKLQVATLIDLIRPCGYRLSDVLEDVVLG